MGDIMFPIKLHPVWSRMLGTLVDVDSEPLAQSPPTHNPEADKQSGKWMDTATQQGER